MKHIFILIIISLSSLGGFAQNSQDTITSKRLYFAYGQIYNLKLDRVYSRLAKNGFTHLFDLGYRNVKNNRIIDLQSSFMIGTLKTKGNDINFINDYAAHLRLRYLKKININNLSVYVGGHVNFGGDVWFPQDSELRYAWDINLGIGLATALYYSINPKLSFQYDLDVSLLGVLWRPHNNGQQLTTEEIQLERGLIASVFETPRFFHMFNNLHIHNSFKLFYSASNKINIYYNFTFSYIHIKQPLIKKGYGVNNAVGIAYKF